MKKRVVGMLVVAVLVVSIVGYYEYSGYESVVVSTSVVMGKITNDQASGAGLPAGGGGLGGVFGGGGQKPASTSTRVSTSTTSKSTTSTTATASGLTFLTISVGSDSFTQILSCGTNSYYAGMTVQVAAQLLRSGAHQYAPDVACKGAVSPFKALYPHGYIATTTATTTTNSTSSTKAP